MTVLHIANKNYSSWSLRPWVLMRELGIPFEERMHPFGHGENFTKFSPSGKVPCLEQDDLLVWDSLAVIETLAESHPEVWPRDRMARAWARSAVAEMHSGFVALRQHCSMSCGVRIRLHVWPPELERDVARLDALWSEGLSRFGGPLLAGAAFTAVDAFFAPVVFRVQTYAVPLSAACLRYVANMLARPSMQQWYAEALAEPWRDEPHELELHAAGEWLADHRS